MKSNTTQTQINKKWVSILGVSLSVLILSFQNCAKTSFTPDLKESNRSIVSATDSSSNSTANSVNTSTGNLNNNSNSNSNSNSSTNDVKPSTASVGTFDCPAKLPKPDPYPVDSAIPVTPAKLVNFGPSPFADSLNNIGSHWSYSNTISLEGNIQFWSLSFSSYNLNGKVTNLKRLGADCNYYYYGSVDLKKGDQILIGSVNKMAGATNSWIIVGVNGSLSLWNNTTLDYTTIGGHNMVGGGVYHAGIGGGTFSTYKCSGNLIYNLTPTVKTVSGIFDAYSPTICADYAQRHINVACVEMGSPNAAFAGLCSFYDGPPVNVGKEVPAYGLIIFTSPQDIFKSKH